MAKAIDGLKVDKGHSYVIIGYSEHYRPDSDKFEKNIKVYNPKIHLGNEGQGDPGKGGLEKILKALKPARAAAIESAIAASKSIKPPTKPRNKTDINAKFKYGRAQIKNNIDARYYGAIEFATLGTARYWLRSKVGRDFLKAYEVVFIQATMGCPIEDQHGL